MNKYLELKNRQQEEFNKLPMGFAFGNDQFNQMLENWGLGVDELDKVAHIYGGVYIQKKDIVLFDELCKKHDDEMKKCIEEDLTGDGFVYDMFYQELSNHEYGYTGDDSDALGALGLTYEEVYADKKLRTALKKAKKDIEAWENE